MPEKRPSLSADPNEISPQGEAPPMLELICGREIVLKLLENRAEEERSSQASMNQ